MPKRKAPRHGYARPAGAVLIALAFAIGVSLVPHQTAPAPRFVAARLSQGFGLGVWLLPFVTLFAGLTLFVRRNFSLRCRTWGTLGGYLVLLVALHLRYPAGRELLAASGRKGGGYAGALITLGLRRMAGEPGLWLATLAGAGTAVALMWGRSLDDITQAALATFVAAGRAAAIAARTCALWLGLAVLWLGRAMRRLALLAPAAARTAVELLRRAAVAGAPIARAIVARIGSVMTDAVQRARDRALPVPPAAEAVFAASPLPGPASISRVDELPAPAGPVAHAPALVPGLSADDPAAAASEPGGVAALPVDGAAGSGAAPPVDPDAVSSVPGGEGAVEEPAASKRARRRRAGASQQALPFPEEPRHAYTVPDLSLLDAFPAKAKAGKVDPEEVARSLERTLASFGVEARVIRWETGPVVTRYELQPAPGVKVQKITSLQNDIALSLAASSVRLEAPIPGKSAIGVELPNERPSLVHLRDILAGEEFARATSPLTVAVGKGIAGTPVVADLVQMPHLLIAGATGAGKSVALNAMIASILFHATPEQARFLMIDPKRVELTNYNGIPHLLSPVVTGPREAAAKLRWAIQEMESRYEVFASDGVRNIQAFNAAHPDRPLAYILIIIDELADLMMVAPADFEEIICRLAQMTRAVGIHLLVATQRPSVDVITGLIKANIPSRVAFSVSSQVDSRTILDHPGAEKLLGRGDMLFSPLGATRPTRVQGAFIGDAETERLVQFWRTQGEPSYVDALVRATAEEAPEDSPGADALLADAARLVVRAGYASVSLLQRKMRIGYVRAARLVDQLEERGIVGPSQGSSPRELLVGLEEMERVLRAGPVGGSAGRSEGGRAGAGRSPAHAGSATEDS